MVGMSVRDEKNPDVLDPEAQGRNALLDQRHARFEGGVNEDVALIGGDEVRDVIRLADVVNVSENPVSGKGSAVQLARVQVHFCASRLVGQNDRWNGLRWKIHTDLASEWSAYH